jgi:polyphosphate kinase
LQIELAKGFALVADKAISLMVLLKVLPPGGFVDPANAIKPRSATKTMSKHDEGIVGPRINGRPKNGHTNGNGFGSKIKNKLYNKELKRLQVELIKLQEWIKHRGLKVVILFEGRDAAGKGGTIKRVSQRMNPRICRVVALGTPTEREKTQWYFQRYAAHLPAAGEMVLFDRSWYNRAGVERVMGFCTEEDYQEFLHSCPEFERMLVRSGILLVKYWFSVSNEEQEKRFQERIQDPTKRWKLSPMDLESRRRWQEYSRAKDAMMSYTDIKQSPWYVVNADNKKRARLNCIRHLLSQIPYQDLTPKSIKLPERTPDKGYIRPPINDQTFVSDYY